MSVDIVTIMYVCVCVCVCVCGCMCVCVWVYVCVCVCHCVNLQKAGIVEYCCVHAVSGWYHA